MQLNKLARLAVPIAACAAVMVACLAAQGVAAPKIKSTSVTLTPAAVTVAEGDVVSLSAKMKPANSTDSLTWSSSDKTVATVTKTGVVTAKSQGSCTITVKTLSRKTATCSVTVKDYLTKEEAEQLIKDGVLSEEDVLELIKSNTLSEADVKKLIADNTLSEADVRRIAASYAGSSGISASEAEAIVKRVTGQTWADGTELELYNAEVLDNVKFDRPGSSGAAALLDDVRITSVTVKKYRCDRIDSRNVKSQYKYVVNIKGSYESDAPDGAYMYVSLLRSDGAASRAGMDLKLVQGDTHLDDVTYSSGNGVFEYTGTAYYIFADYDRFEVSNPS